MRIVTALLFADLCASHSQAQETQSLSRSVIKLSPQHFTDNSLKAGIERFNKTHTTSIALLVTAKLEKDEDGFAQYGYNGLAGELQFRKYVRPMKMITTKKNRLFHQGIYGAAYVQAGSYSGEFNGYYFARDPITGTFGTPYNYDYKESTGNWGFGFTMGYQRTLWEVIFLEAFLGGGIQFSDRILTGLTPPANYFGDELITDPAYKGIMPKIGLNIGLGL
jgi:hypothetical protein